MKYTKVYATGKEVIELTELVNKAERTPAFAVTSEHAASGGFSNDAWQRVFQTCHKHALAHDLPEIEGYYGIDLYTGEFVSY